MKNTFKVFRYEFLTAIRKKSFLISSIITLLLVVGMMSVPKILTSIEKAKTEKDQDKIGYVESDKTLGLEKYFLDGSLIKEESVQKLKEAMKLGEVKKGFYYDKDEKLTLIVKDTSFKDNNDEVLKAIGDRDKEKELSAKGIDYYELEEIVNRKPEYKIENIGVDGTKNFAAVYILIFVVYFIILNYGSQVATAVAREKNDRTMEILITSTKATSLINGKVLAYGLVGLLSVGIFGIATLVGYLINKGFYSNFTAIFSFNLDLKTIIVFLVFFVLGYLMYLYLYAGIGSMVTKVEEVNQAITPIMLIFILGYMATMLGLTDPNGPILLVASFIPFFSLMTMFVRVALTSAPLIHILISFLILLTTTILLSLFSVKLYRQGSLNYGNKLSIIKMFKQGKS